jgi:hypothetical protein
MTMAAKTTVAGRGVAGRAVVGCAVAGRADAGHGVAGRADAGLSVAGRAVAGLSVSGRGLMAAGLRRQLVSIFIVKVYPGALFVTALWSPVKPLVNVPKRIHAA